MGITIYYSGKILEKNRIDDFVNELCDICQTMNWEFDTFTFENMKFFEGVSLRLPFCETLHFCFDSMGRLIQPMLIEKQISTNKYPDSAYNLFCKTQYGGAEAHKIIIKLIQYLTLKYELEIEVADETNYWNSNDESDLVQKFDKMNFIIDGFKNAINGEKNEFSELSNRLLVELEKFKKKLDDN
ncbi:MAG: hypothetical protein ACK5UE_11600 [Chitinophagales bacterium]|jgi:hypothetical protein|nr:hypothetical protein [Sphingobacteriales bacterium]